MVHKLIILHLPNSIFIFFQLSEHLKVYYATWKTYLNAKHTRISTMDTRKATDSLVRDPIRLSKAPPTVPERPPYDPKPTAGLLPIELDNSPSDSPAPPHVHFEDTTSSVLQS